MNILITGAGGLRGSEAVEFYSQFDNKMPPTIGLKSFVPKIQNIKYSKQKA
jgi:hypothetical protein